MSVRSGKRKTATERREHVVRAAIVEFATYGYHGGSTERIASHCSISQPYVLQLFGTKKALFIAALGRVCQEIIAAWDEALASFLEANEGRQVSSGERLRALQDPFRQFVESVVELRLVLQASAAADDDEIRSRLKAGMADMFDWVRNTTGASYEEVQMFWAHGMMLMMAASIGAGADAGQAEWARAMLMMPNVPAEDTPPAPDEGASCMT